MAMNPGNRKKKIENRGFTLLIAIIFMSVMLSFGLALGSIAYKQQVLASSAVESQYAFYVADAALECALYADQHDNLFTNPPMGTPFNCGGRSFSVSTSTYSSWLVSTVQIPLDSSRCADVAVYKPTSTGTTYLFSQGYDVSCSTIGTNPRSVSRGIQAHY